MILKDNLLKDLEVKFVKADWDLGIARQAIRMLKEEFNGSYRPYTKKWIVKSFRAEEARKALRKLEEDASTQYEQYDIDLFTKQFEDEINESEKNKANAQALRDERSSLNKKLKT